MEILNSAKIPREAGGKLDVGAGVWADEMANEVEMADVGGDERPTTPIMTPTPARWASAIPVPVTPTKSSKRMALGTRKPGRHHLLLRVRMAPFIFAAQLALVQILAAVARMEGTMEERMAAL